MKISTLLRAVYSINRWQYYIPDLYIELIQKKIWKLKKLSMGKNIKWFGLPIITNTKGAKIYIGNNCFICSRSYHTSLGVSHKMIIRTLEQNSKIHIGNNVRMSGTAICAASTINIGDRCVIGADVIIADNDFHSIDPIIRSSVHDSGKLTSKPIKIGDDVFIGGRSIILKGVELGNNVVVGAGSVVTKFFPEGSIIAGNPAEIIGNINKY